MVSIEFMSVEVSFSWRNIGVTMGELWSIFVLVRRSWIYFVWEREITTKLMFFVANSWLSWVIKSVIKGSLIITTNKNVIHIYKKNNGDITCMINEQRRVSLGIIECVSKYWIFDIYIYIYIERGKNYFEIIWRISC